MGECYACGNRLTRWEKFILISWGFISACLLLNFIQHVYFAVRPMNWIQTFFSYLFFRGVCSDQFIEALPKCICRLHKGNTIWLIDVHIHLETQSQRERMRSTAKQRDSKLLKDPMAWNCHFMRFSNINMSSPAYDPQVARNYVRCKMSSRYLAPSLCKHADLESFPMSS